MSSSSSTRQINYVAFNQDGSLINVATRDGFRLYSCKPFRKVSSFGGGGLNIAQNLMRTSLVAVVGDGSSASFSPRRVLLYNTKTMKRIVELNYRSTVLDVQLNEKRMVVVFPDSLVILDTSTMKELHRITIPHNPSGTVALSPDSNHCYLAFPASDPPATSSSTEPPPLGEVLLYDALNLQVVSIIPAHQNPVRALAFSRDGSMLATASDQGTVIRVFSVPNGEKLCTFRRGSRPAHVLSMAFNADSTLLCMSSNTNTVHVFALTGDSASSIDESEEKSNSAPSTDHNTGSSDLQPSASMSTASSSSSTTASSKFFSSLQHMQSTVTQAAKTAANSAASAASSVKAYIPTAVSAITSHTALQDWVDPSRSFAKITLQENTTSEPSAVLCGFGAADQGGTRTLLMLSSAGVFSRYHIGVDGQCTLLSEDSVLDAPSEMLEVKLHASSSPAGTPISAGST